MSKLMASGGSLKWPMEDSLWSKHAPCFQKKIIGPRYDFVTKESLGYICVHTMWMIYVYILCKVSLQIQHLH